MATLVEANFPIIRRKHLLHCYENQQNLSSSSLSGVESDCPLGPRLWIVGSSFAAASVREQLIEKIAKPILEPGVRTLRQAAETLASMASESWHPLSKVQQRWLVGKIAEEGKHSGSLGPLQELAASRGLVDLLVTRFDQIRELGLSVEASGEHLRRSEGRAGNAMSRLYENYCERLHAVRLFDKAARFDLACREVEAWPEPLDLLILDTLVPTSPIEERFVTQLIAHSKETLISVVGRPRDQFGEFTNWNKLAKKLSTSREGFESATIVTPEKRLDDPADDTQETKPTGSLKSLSSRIFLNAKESLVVSDLEVTLADDEKIEVVATASAQEELRQIVRRIKTKLVNDSAKPDEIVVATKHLGRHTMEIEATFAEYGIPVQIESTSLLKDYSWIHAVKQLLEVANTDWQQEPLLALLSRREFKAIQPAERHDAERLVRELGLPGGARYLIQQTESLASRLEDPYPPRHAEIARSGLGALMSISDALDKLPERATPLAWFDSICHAMQQLQYRELNNSKGILQQSNASSFGQQAFPRRDRLAREALEAAFLELELLTQWRSSTSHPQLSLRDLCKLVADWSERLTIPSSTSSEAKVQVVSAETAIGLTPKHLFLVRLDESSFAAVASSDSQEEEQESVERLLFQQLIALPRESLTLSYTALDEKAVTLHPSPFVTEVERFFPPDTLRRSNYRLGKIDLTEIPYSLREQRLQAIASVVEGKAELLGTLFQQQESLTRDSLRGSLDVVSERWRGDSFGLAEGICSSKTVAEWLSQKYGPTHHWSASQLETYASCPFKFFSKYLLDANPVGDSQFEVDYRRRGTLLHDAMVELHQTLSKRLGRGDRLSEFPTDELSALFREAVVTVATSRGLPSHEIALAEIEQEQTLAWADLYPKQTADFDAQWSTLDDPLKPRYYEARFGPMHRDPSEEVEDEVSIDEPYPFKLPNGEVLLLTGKIDRIDVGEIAGQTVFGIVDYKTGSNNATKQEEIISGKKLQLALYALAAEELFFDTDNAVPIAAGYWDIKEKGFLGAGKLELAKIDEKGAALTPDWAETIEAVRGRVQEIVNGVRHGEFPMYNTDKECGRYCDYQTVCRVGQVRNRDKVWPPPPEQSPEKTSKPNAKKSASGDDK